LEKTFLPFPPADENYWIPINIFKMSPLPLPLPVALKDREEMGKGKPLMMCD
jgi:hypothetical protein